jgi:multidrug efflux pump subunit AcrA (membrane-fusion protein)
MREEEKRMAQAKYESAKALADYATARYERTKALFDKDQAISLEDLEQSLSASIAAEKAKAAAAEENALAQIGQRKEKKLQAEDRLNMQAQAVKHLEDRRAKYANLPYFSGYVNTKYAEVGAWIKQGDPLVEVIELDPVEISVAVPESYIDKVEPGMDVQVRVDAVSTREAFVGKVSRIIPEGDLRSRTFTVKVQLKNPLKESVKSLVVSPENDSAAEKEEDPADQKRSGEDVQAGEVRQHVFKSGMLARVLMRLGERNDAVMVHKDALVLGGATLDGQPSYSVFIAQPAPDGKSHVAQPVQVALGMYEGDWVEVASRIPNALTKDSLVVTVGNERLRPGQPIQFAPPK